MLRFFSVTASFLSRFFRLNLFTSRASLQAKRDFVRHTMSELYPLGYSPEQCKSCSLQCIHFTLTRLYKVTPRTLSQKNPHLRIYSDPEGGARMEWKQWYNMCGVCARRTVGTRTIFSTRMCTKSLYTVE